MIDLCANSGMLLNVVPSEFWALEVVADEPTAVVACPCGADHRVAFIEGPFVFDCKRGFFFTGEDVVVINLDIDRTPVAPT